MLHAAGALTIRLARSLLSGGISFERRDPHNPTWLAYSQFVRTFLLPLLANRHRRIPLSQIFTNRAERLEREESIPCSTGCVPAFSPWSPSLSGSASPIRAAVSTSPAS